MPKVLIIDYDPRAIKALCDPIENSGYVVIQAADGRQGLLDFKAHHPDLVIVEAMIPKRSGFELCQEIRKTDKETPVIIVSSVYKGRRYRTQAIHQCGATDFIEKPIDPVALLKRVDSLTGGTRASSAAVTSKPRTSPPSPDKAADPATAGAPVSTLPVVKPCTDSVEDEIGARIDSLLGN